jgi:hypothetical protein
MTIAKLAGLLLPHFGVTSLLPTERVCDLVQNHLLYLVQVARGNQVAGYSDALLRVITESGSANGSIEPK